MVTATKQDLAKALLKLAQAEPFKKISVQKLTEAAGINRQTFYYHFSDKNQLLRWVYQEDSLHFLDAAEVNIDNWEEQALKMLTAMNSNQNFYQHTVKDNAEILVQEFITVIHQLFIKLFENMDVEHELSVEDKQFYARFFSYGCSGILTSWILEGFQETPLEISVQLFRLAKDTEFFSYRLYAKEQSDEKWGSI
ncbi:TetR/AcrR family transcriptional regulator [Enterococcus sp. LJL120]